MCEMLSPSIQSFDSLFEEDWRNAGGQGLDLASVGGFDATFSDHDGELKSDQANFSGDIDPQFLNGTSCSAQCNAPYQDHSMTTALSSLPHGGMFDTCPPPPANSPNNGGGPVPYFHHQVEQPSTFMLQQPLYGPSPLRNQLHKRSVSEPPGQHNGLRTIPPHHPPSNPTFTRSGTPLGIPKTSVSTASRSSTRSRQPIYRQPYSVAKRQAPRSERHQLRSTQTRPVHLLQPPTSHPLMDSIRSPPQQPRTMTPVVSTRVCTPTVSTDSITSPGNLDLGSVSPRSAPKTIPPQGVTIAVTAEELKTMIADAVREGVAAAMGAVISGSVSQTAAHAGVDQEHNEQEQDSKDSDGVEASMDELMEFAGGRDVRKSIEEDTDLFGPE